MNLSPYALLRAILATSALVALPSCEGVPGEYGPNYGGYDDGPGYSPYQSSPTYYGSGTGYYGGGYSRPSYGSSYYGGSRYYNGRYYNGNDRDHDHNDYRSSGNDRRRGHDDHDDHDDHRSSGNDRNRSSSSSRRSSSGDDIRLVKVRDGTRGDVPEGYHDREYYQKRGISLSKNVYETREGDRRGYSGNTSRSSSSSNKSNSNKSGSEKSSSNKSNSSSGGRRKG